MEQISELLLMVMYNSNKSKEALDEISERLKKIETEITERNETKVDVDRQ